MIVILRKSNILLVVLILLLSIAIYSLNFTSGNALSTAKAQEAQHVIMLDPGHGGEDPGAVSDYSGIKESTINLYIAKKVKEDLEKAGYKILMTRAEDRLEYTPGTRSVTEMRRQDLTRRKKMMDEDGAEVVVSIHLNKFLQTQYFGAQTFYPESSPESQKLAGFIQDSLKQLVDPTNKRVAMVKGKPGDPPIIILRNLKTPTAVVECGFLSNQEEEKKLGTVEYQDKLAVGISDGVKKFFEAKAAK